MPSVVLRNPNLPGQPIVVDVPVGGYIPENFRSGGFEVDPDTDPADALLEIDETQAAATERVAAEAADFTPSFAPDVSSSAPRGADVEVAPAAPAAPVPVQPPAEPVQDETAPAALDLSKE